MRREPPNGDRYFEGQDCAGGGGTGSLYSLVPSSTSSRLTGCFFMRSRFSSYRLAQGALLGAIVLSSSQLFAQAAPPGGAAPTTPEAPKAPAPVTGTAPAVPPKAGEAPRAPQPTGAAAGSAFSAPPSPDAPVVPAEKPEAQPPCSGRAGCEWQSAPPTIKALADDLQGASFRFGRTSSSSGNAKSISTPRSPPARCN